ncbi:hypothetical protein AMTR_s00007p00265900 [Amborella trichopoda]|uniref:Peptidase S26 domain-containing protein n=1 Tax=Amborella trichopoda TaxID=13333 RepID=W1PC75_AMBTC|nr:hypothetical protein AMTR_s00007p00265900 [Amborella trichopoda]
MAAWGRLAFFETLLFQQVGLVFQQVSWNFGPCGALLIWSRDGGFGTHLDERETSGPSMAPTLNNDGDVLIVERLSSRHGRIYPGDIVIACSPQNPNIKICKRVIGLEGDHISFHPNVGSRKVITVTVPKGHVWLQGDNIMHSQDSRHYGPVPFALLKGKVWMRFCIVVS